MNILLLRLLVIFYICGVVFLLFSLITANVVKNKHAFIGLLFFPILLLSSKGRAFLKEITKG